MSCSSRAMRLRSSATRSRASRSRSRSARSARSASDSRCSRRRRRLSPSTNAGAQRAEAATASTTVPRPASTASTATSTITDPKATTARASTLGVGAERSTRRRARPASSGRRRQPLARDLAGEHGGQRPSRGAAAVHDRRRRGDAEQHVHHVGSRTGVSLSSAGTWRGGRAASAGNRPAKIVSAGERVVADPADRSAAWSTTPVMPRDVTDGPGPPASAAGRRPSARG